MADYTKKTLQMTFNNSVGKSLTLSFPYPKEDIITTEIESAMDTLIAKDIIFSNNGDLLSKKDGGVIEKTFTDLVD
ncbi:MAG: DUF2922 domain-containing protein [Caldisericia bacterium]|nr:DUF2922 domain-containing protein [Caldisericia bacterium]